MQQEDNLIEKISWAELNLQRKLDWIGRYDTRIVFITGISIAMMGVLMNACISVVIWNCSLYITFGASLILLLGSLILLYFGQYPKTVSPNDSLIFFGTIASLKLDAFQKKFMKMSDKEYLEDLLSQVHINSVILKKKFWVLKASLIFILIAIIPWSIALYQSKLLIK